MATELATGYVSLAVSTRGLGRDITREFDGVSKGAGKEGGRAGKAFGTGLRLAGGAALGGAALLIGKTFTAGLDRYMSTENAEAKLRALGNSAQDVQKIMDSAREVSLGTAFNVGEAASTAATLVASGIKPGQKLTETLRTIANTAAVAGLDMQSVGVIFGKVAASGKVQGDELQQLLENNIPAVVFLSEELGVSADRVYEMASAGEIGFDTFQRAMQRGMDPQAAKIMGNTLIGSAKNIQSAFARVGLALLEFVGPALKQGLDLGIGALDEMEDAVLSANATIKALFAGGEGGGPSPMVSALTQMQTLITQVTSGLQSYLLPAFTAVSKAAGQLWAAIAPVAAELGSLFSEKMAQWGPQLAPMMTQVVDIITQAFTIIGQIVTPIILGLVLLFKAAALAITQAWAVLGPTIIPLLSVAFDMIMGIIMNALDIIQGLFTAFSALLRGDWQGVWDGLSQVVSGVLGLIQTIIFAQLSAVMIIFNTVGAAIGSAWNSMWSGLSTTVSTALAGVGAFISGALAGIAGFFMATATAIRAAWFGLWSGLSMAAQTALGAIQTIVGGALMMIRTVFSTVVGGIRVVWANFWGFLRGAAQAALTAIQNVISVVLTTVRTIFTNVTNAIRAGWFNFWNVLRGVASSILNNIRGIITGILNSIRAIFNAITNGIRAMWMSFWNNLRATAQAVLSAIRGFITGALNGIRNTFNAAVNFIRNRWTSGFNAVRNTATNVMRSVRTGIDRALGGIRRAFETAVSAIGRAWDGIKGKAKEPVKFVIDTVYNKGIRNAFNAVAGIFGMEQLGEISAGFAQGGVLPGYTPGRDVHSFYSATGGRLDLSGGEGILRPEVTRALGARGIAMLNRFRGDPRKIRDILADIFGHQKLAQGGLVSGSVVGANGFFTRRFAAVIQQAMRMSGQRGRPSQGGFRPQTSYSGASHAGDAIDIIGILPRLNRALRALGVASWQRNPSQGSWPWHLHAVPGPTAGRAGGSGRSQWASYVRGGNGLGGRDDGPRVGTNRGLLDKLGEFTGGAFDAVTNLFMGGVDAIRGLFKGALDKKVPGSGWFADLVGRVPGKIVDGIVNTLKDKVPGFASGGVTPGGPIMVGERGPELMWPGAGNLITPNGWGGSLDSGSAEQIAQVVDQVLSARLTRLGPQEVYTLARDGGMRWARR